MHNLLKWHTWRMPTAGVYKGCLALARIRLGLDVGPGWSCCCCCCCCWREFCACMAPKRHVDGYWLLLCCVWQGALLQRVTWQEYKQRKAACGVTDWRAGGSSSGRAWGGVMQLSKQCKGGCMRWRNWFLNSMPPLRFTFFLFLMLQRKSTHVVSKS